MTDVWDDVDSRTAAIPRDRFGRPQIPPSKGGKPVAHTRFSVLAETLDDRYRLEMWKGRKQLAGVYMRPDLVRLAMAKKDDRDALDEIVKDLQKAAGSEQAANDGTVLHSLIEQDLKGEDISHISPELAADIAAMRACLDRHSFTVVHIERFMVNATLKAAGTPDLILEREGQLYVGDWKSGQIEYGTPRIAIQEALAAHAETFYSPVTGHEPVPQINTSRGYIFHCPFGTGTCNLYELDIVAGWEAAKTARWVRTYRNRRDLTRSVTAAADEQSALREQIGFRIEALPPEAILALSTMVVNAGLPRVSKATGQDLTDLVELVTFIEGEYEVPFEKPKRVEKK